MKSLPPRQNRLFVIAFMAMLFGLSILAAVLITKGWDDEGLQQRVGQQEAERAQQAPRL